MARDIQDHQTNPAEAKQVTEYIDVVDEQGHSTGITLPRERIHAEGHLHKTVHIWVYNSAKEILVQKRHHAKDSYPGRWDISSAGHISSGESTLSSACRELFEELGIDAKEESLRFLFSQRQSNINPSENFFDNEIASVFAICTDLPISSMRLQETEVSALRYMKTGDLAVESQTELFVPHPIEYAAIIKYVEDVLS